MSTPMEKLRQKYDVLLSIIEDETKIQIKDFIVNGIENFNARLEYSHNLGQLKILEELMKDLEDLK